MCSMSDKTKMANECKLKIAWSLQKVSGQVPFVQSLEKQRYYLFLLFASHKDGHDLHV